MFMFKKHPFRRALSFFLILLTVFLLSTGCQKGTGSSSAVGSAFYIKDNDLYYKRMDQSAPILLQKEIVTFEDESAKAYTVDPYFYQDFQEYFQANISGDVVLYPETIFTYTGYSGPRIEPADTYYIRNLNHPNEEPYKISLADGGEVYHLSTNGDSLTYSKNNKAYRLNLKDKTETFIAKDFHRSLLFLYFSLDNQYCYAADRENNIYLYGEGEPELVLADYQIFENKYRISKDFSCFYYIKDNALYCKKIGQEAYVIDSGEDLNMDIAISDAFAYNKGDDTYFYDGEKSIPFAETDLSKFRFPEEVQLIGCGDHLETQGITTGTGFGVFTAKDSYFYTSHDTNSLCHFSDNQKKVIAENIADIAIASQNGTALYLDQDKTLYFFNGSESAPVDENVDALVCHREEVFS